MNYFLQGFGVFLGVIAGTAVTILANWIIQQRQNAQTISNLKFEIAANIERISQWQEKVTAYRNAVNAEALHTWAEYLNFSQIMRGTAEETFRTGIIYRYLDNKHISFLQAFLFDFAIGLEQIANQKIMEQRNAFNKQEAIMFITYLEKKLADSKSHLREILDKLKEKMA